MKNFQKQCFQDYTTDYEVMYQDSPLVGHEESIAYLTAHKNEYMELVLTCLKERVKLQHLELLTDTLTLLATHGWQRSDKLEFADAALHSLSAKFAVPL